MDRDSRKRASRRIVAPCAFTVVEFGNAGSKAAVAYRSPFRIGTAGVLPLRAHCILFGIIVTLPMAILSGGLLYRIAAEDRLQAEQHALATVAGIAADIDRDLQRRVTILRTLATSASLARGEVTAFHAEASAVLKEDGATLLVLDRSGRSQVLNTSVAYGTLLPAYASPETAQRVIEARTPQISDFSVDRVTRRAVVDVAIPVIRGGEVEYVMALRLVPTFLQQTLRAAELPEGWAVSVADRGGVVLARSYGPDSDVGRALPSTLADQPHGTVLRETSVAGLEVLRATAQSEAAGWQVALLIPAAAVDAAFNERMRLLLFETLAAIALAALGATVFARAIARPIQQASRAASGLVRGEEVQRSKSHILEARSLFASLETASAELARANQRNTLLRQEAEHRVKNLLSVMISMTGRILDADRFREARDLLVPRLYSLARAHGLLVANSWEGASLATLVETELAAFAGRIRAAGPDFVAGPAASQALVMILHELATNAVKYGALSTPTGRIDLTWTLQGEDDPVFILRWEESGGPPVTPPVSQGFGSTVLCRALLEAQARLDFEPGGLVYEVRAPVSAIGGRGPPLTGHDTSPRGDGIRQRGLTV